MRSSLVALRQFFHPIRIALIAALTLLLSGWTCNAMFGFRSCEGVVPQPQITALSPDSILSDTASVLLTVDGSGFTPQSQIMWNRNSLETTFVNSQQLQTTITQQTIESFGGSAGSSVQISVRSNGSVADLECPNVVNSATMILVID